jgi:hypothetical protein
LEADPVESGGPGDACRVVRVGAVGPGVAIAMELTFECPNCHEVGEVARLSPKARAVCNKCGQARELRPDSFEGGELRSCPLCATDDLYIQKDFPHGLGLAIVVAGFVVSTVFWYFDRPVPALGVLLVSALVDMVLFRVVPDVTICYRCLSQYRGEGANAGGRFHPFDLAVGERYRQERLRIAELKARPGTPGPTPPS